MNITQKIKPVSKLQRLPLGEITASGWIKQQLEIEAEGMGGHLDELEPNSIYTPFITRENEKGLGEVARVGWSAEFSGTYWTGLVQLAFTLDDEKLKRKAENWVNAVLANQEPDGYIGAYKKDVDRNNDLNAWGCYWEMRALLSYYEATSRNDILDACHKGLRWFVREWKEYRSDYIGQMLIESMVSVYLYTGDKDLLDWSEDFIRWFNANHPKSQCSLDGLKNKEYIIDPFGKEDATHHAVAYGEIVKLPAILYTSNNRRDYLARSVNGLERVIRKCFQLTGAPSSNHEKLGVIGSNCETEYCNFETYIYTFGWMAAITGEAKYGDLIEKITFNGAQGAKKKDGKAIAYMSSPNQLYARRDSTIYGAAPDLEVYAPNYPVACCPTHSVGVIPEFVRNMCMKDENSDLYFMSYGPCNIETGTANGGVVRIEETTCYPFGDEMKFKVSINKPAIFKLYLKIPAWCGNASLRINGEAIDTHAANEGFLSVGREWRNGDCMVFALPMKVCVAEVNDGDYNNNRPVAIEKGPLLFSLPIKEKWLEYKGAPHVAPDCADFYDENTFWRNSPFYTDQAYCNKGFPINELPDGWWWYEAEPDDADDKNAYPWSYYAVDRELISNGWNISVICDDTGNELPWIKSPVRIRLPMRKVKYDFPDNPRQTSDILTKPVETEGESEFIELVPYGCTNLRISYFPIVIK